MVKKHLSEMTTKEKFEHFKYVSYRYNKFSMEEYLEAIDDEFLDMCLKSPYDARFNSFFAENNFDVTLFFKKLGDGSGIMNSKQEKLLKNLIITQNSKAVDIQRELSQDDNNKIADFAENYFNESKRKGGLLTTFAVTLSFDKFQRIVDNNPNLSLEDINQFVSGMLSGERRSHFNEKNVRYFLNQPEIKDYLIKNMDSADFYYVASKFNLGEEAILDRQRHSVEILKNAKNMSFESVKNALADIMFRTNSKNAVLDIETLLDYAKSSKNYGQQLDNFYTYLDMVKGVLEQEKEPENYEKNIDKIIEQIMTGVDKLKANGIDFYQIMQKESLIAKSMFYSQMENATLETRGKIFNGADIKFVQYGEHIVPIYTIAKQTKNQENFYLLVHTQDVRGNTPEQALQGYYDLRCNRSTNCCSVVSDKHLTVFGSTNVVFGYFGFHGAEMLSATSCDGQTGQRHIAGRKDRKVYKQNYASNEDFVANSGDSHNEIAFSSTSIDEQGVMKPDYVVSFTETPSEKDMLAAAAFGVPIIYINPEMYKSQETAKTTRAKEYVYPVFAPPKEREQMQSEMN